MALPLPKVVADVGPGGPFVTSNMGVNALTASNLENAINRVKAQYAPLTTQAEAASKLAYANLMGPQFLAKLLANPDVVANMQNPQSAVNSVVAAGNGQGTGANIFSKMGQPAALQDNSVFGLLLRKIAGAIKGEQPSAQSNVFNNPVPAQTTNAGINSGVNSGYSYDRNGNNVVATPQEIDQAGTQPAPQIPANTSEIAMATKAWQASPEAKAQAEKEGYYTIPDTNSLLNWYRNQNANAAPVSTATGPLPYAEKAGQFKGNIKQGEEAGKLRADTINDMGKEYQASLRLNDSYEEMKNLINEPEFQKMRQDIPFFQNMQMNALSKIGTPYQQEMIGTFKSAAQVILANAVNSFEGRKFVGEFKTTNDMKINDNDTFNTIVGKMQAGMLLNNYDRQRVAIASQLMKNNHMDQQEALEAADKQLDRKKIEDDIKNLVRITIKNKKTGEVKTIPIHEARKMGVPNV